MPNSSSRFAAASHALGAVQTVADFRIDAARAHHLSSAERRTLVEQALILINDIYVHLPLKKAMHSIDPVQRLRLLKSRVDSMSELDFHSELLATFNSLRDLHTNYTLPAPYQGRFAFLGLMIERFEDNGRSRWMVSKVAEGLSTVTELVPGVELTHWNGMPMDIAVWRNAQKEAGSNEAARLARGLESMTLRALASSLPPDEDWVDLAFVADGQTHEARLNWFVFNGGNELRQLVADPASFFGTPLRHQVALDWRTEAMRRIKKKLFSASACEEERKVKAAGNKPLEATAEQAAARVIPTARPDDISARLVETPDGTFGYLKLWTFHMKDQDINGFVSEVMRLLDTAFPPQGLILDVRGNGGGYVIAAEFLLQLLTPHVIEPEPTQFINTPATRKLTDTATDMRPWQDSLVLGLSTGAQYSNAIPLSDPGLVNSVGQLYHGPVVLITDAFCYSACDMFAGGFKDHDIGIVLGVDDATGAGGANVLDHESLRRQWQGGPLRTLPGGADMRVSLRRTLRVGELAGQPVEDLGVKPDIRAQLTQNDLLNGNEDLLNTAGKLLSQQTPRALDMGVLSDNAGQFYLEVEALNVPEVDVYINGRPQSSQSTPSGTSQFPVDLPTGEVDIRLEGYDNGQLVAACNIDLRV